MNLLLSVEPMVLRFFLLLLAGHVLSDFLFQTSGIANNKGSRFSALLLHGMWTFAVHAVLLFPFWNRQALLWLPALALSHIVIDRLKAGLRGDAEKAFTGFFVDQGIHLVTLIALTWIVSDTGHMRRPSIAAENLDALVGIMVVAAGFVFNGKGGTAVVRLLLNRFPTISDPLRKDSGSTCAMGRTIGNLERYILFVLVLLGHWGAIGFVIGAKSIARFKELDEKGFADYYLIGTLTSVLVALISGLSVSALLGLLD